MQLNGGKGRNLQSRQRIKGSIFWTSPANSRLCPSVRPSVRLSGQAEEKEGAQKDFTPGDQRHTRPELLTHCHNNTALLLPAHIRIATLPSAARTGRWGVQGVATRPGDPRQEAWREDEGKWCWLAVTSANKQTATEASSLILAPVIPPPSPSADNLPSPSSPSHRQGLLRHFRGTLFPLFFFFFLFFGGAARSISVSRMALN